jgi:large conductance mechanosensitive channel
MSIIKEFRDFAIKGNVVDMAIGIIIGGAFGKIVSSLVADIIMPPLGILIGGVKFAQLSLVLREATEAAPAVTWNYGQFLQNVVDFVIVAFAIFMAIKTMNQLKRREEKVQEAAPAAPSAQEVLLTEIRDLLKDKVQK